MAFSALALLFATIHAVLGTLAELLGLYIVLVAATNLLPESFRFKNYKLWMRTELALWWVVLLFGIGTYYYWYIRPSNQTKPVFIVQPQQTSSRLTVRITNFSFEPKEVTITAGTTVEWIDETGKHSVVADDDSFDSDILDAGGRFEHKYDKPGVYPYYCALHGDKGGKEMAGVVKVKE
jgi:plastocyanin